MRLLALVFAFAVGCSSRATTTTGVGSGGGTIVVGGLRLTIPAHALSSPVDIQITTSSTAPAGYTLDSLLYHFAPDGLRFALPATVSMPLLDPSVDANLYWSDASGGFSLLPSTRAGSSLVATIE